jgi:hypothetical protein
VHAFPLDFRKWASELFWSWQVMQSDSCRATVSDLFPDPCGSWQAVQSPLPIGPCTSLFLSIRLWHR